MKSDICVVIGAGITGLSAAYHLRERGIELQIVERNKTYGGLCNSFCIDGFVFDTFAHISFDNDPYTFSMIEGRTPYCTHAPEAMNYCDCNWVRNPVQNNLLGLPIKERIGVIKDYCLRPRFSEVKTYSDWLDAHFGSYFATRYPKRYTRKYWTVDAEKLDYRWIEGRMTTPRFMEMVEGTIRESKSVQHYSKEARYPVNGGFKAFIRPLAQDADILYNTYVTEIDTSAKIITLSDGQRMKYEGIISTIPLPELVRVVKDVPEKVLEAADQLDHTSGAIISLGFNRPGISPRLWFYIYDEDIYPARVYSPDWESTNNVPEGCSALQAEVYFSKYKPLNGSLDDLKNTVIEHMLRLGLFSTDDILFSDIKYIEYANVMFTPKIYEARDSIHRYLDSIGIVYAGRWGEWDYLWVGQSLRSGKRAAEKVGMR